MIREGVLLRRLTEQLMSACCFVYVAVYALGFGLDVDVFCLHITARPLYPSPWALVHLKVQSQMLWNWMGLMAWLRDSFTLYKI